MTSQPAATNHTDAVDASPAQVRAVTRDHFGSGEVLGLEQVAAPRPGPGEVVVAVRAASVNPVDWHMMTGEPLVMRIEGGWRSPKNRRLGLDVAGVVTAVGEGVEHLSVGDEVFGAAEVGSFAEAVRVPADRLVRKPVGVTFEHAAAVPVAACTALQGLRDHGQLQPGQHVLVNGASGGVGTYAVQVAKHLGAQVTGVCSTRNVELVQSLGADHVVDYTDRDFTDHGVRYDVVLDNVGHQPLSHVKRCLTPTGALVLVSGPKGRVFGPLGHLLRSMASFAFGRQRVAPMFTQITAADLETCATLLASGALRSVVEASYPLDQIAAAMDHVGTGRTRGKVVVTP
ncbi:MAG: NAD(P)-dependent alcohol dehydrogenase [Myxococcales bacterium]|nr:NAD(P)-dependent alcohol dehydrogenase [Myxococcales bacterium]